MKTNKKEILLDDDERELIAKAAQATGKHWKQVLRESLALIVSSRREASDSNWSQFLEKVNELPLAVSEDNICVSSDHDKILYEAK